MSCVRMPQVMKPQAREVGPSQEPMPCVGQRLRLDRLPIFASTDEAVIVKPDAEPQQLLSLLCAPGAQLRHDLSRQCDLAATTRFGSLEPYPEARLFSSITGTLVRGTERVSTAHCLDLLGVDADPVTRQRMAKRLPSRMKMLGWHGPRALRISGPSPVQGYWRVPYALPANGVAPADVVGGPVEVLSGELPAELDRVTRLGLGTIAKILKAPFDPSDGNLTRSQVTAAGIAINAQLKADDHALRQQKSGDVLERLLKLIEEEKKKIPDGNLTPVQPTEHVELERSDAEAGVMAPSGDGSEEG